MKARGEFNRDRSRRDGRNPYCRACEVWRKRRGSYGITRDEFERKLKAQGWGCAICGETEPPTHSQAPDGWTVDHDHRTGAVRGILCQRCNTDVGRFESGRGEAVAAYLRLHARD